MELTSQKDITEIVSFQLHVDIDLKYNLNHFPLIESMIIEITCLSTRPIYYKNCIFIYQSKYKFLFKHKETFFHLKSNQLS